LLATSYNQDMENISDLLAREPNVNERFLEAVRLSFAAWRQPHYTDCRNCGDADHSGYRCPCACHSKAIQRPLPGADFQALTRRDEEMPVGYGHPVDISEYFKGGR
jgi:hypothetical protein